MKPELSIITPCYNCSATLEEAVESCFHQGLKNFEIVLVDDCSTDDTKAVMQKLAAKHSEIRLAYHDKNKGGGATRNTAVKEAKADVIFCLDSDDMLGENTLSKMLAYLHKNSCDGVGVAKSIKFKGRNVKDVAFINDFARVGEKIQFTDLFEKETASCSLYSVFMHTKKAFDIAGGYPTDHGFDTQSFAFRFLANGLNAHTCPDTTYLHRISFNASYYIREYESGKINHNWFKIYDEFFYLFNDETKKEILAFDLNNGSKSLNDHVKNKKEILRTDYERFIVPGGKESFTKSLSAAKKESLSPFDLYWLGSEYLRVGKMENAAEYLSMAANAGLRYDTVLVKLHNTGLAKGDDIDRAVKSFYSYKTQGSKAPILVRIWRKIKRSL